MLEMTTMCVQCTLFVRLVRNITRVDNMAMYNKGCFLLIKVFVEAFPPAKQFLAGIIPPDQVPLPQSLKLRALKLPRHPIYSKVELLQQKWWRSFKINISLKVSPI